MLLGNDENLMPPTGWGYLFKQRLLIGTLCPEMPSFRRHECTIRSGGGVGLSFQATSPERDVAPCDAVLSTS